MSIIAAYFRLHFLAKICNFCTYNREIVDLIAKTSCLKYKRYLYREHARIPLCFWRKRRFELRHVRRRKLKYVWKIGCYWKMIVQSTACLAKSTRTQPNDLYRQPQPLHRHPHVMHVWMPIVREKLWKKWKRNLFENMYRSCNVSASAIIPLKLLPYPSMPNNLSRDCQPETSFSVLAQVMLRKSSILKRGGNPWYSSWIEFANGAKGYLTRFK